jgi:hypothetical protein
MSTVNLTRHLPMVRVALSEGRGSRCRIRLCLVIVPATVFFSLATAPNVSADGVCSPTQPVVQGCVQFVESTVSSTQQLVEGAEGQSADTVQQEQANLDGTVMPALGPVDANDPVANTGATKSVVGGTWTAYQPSDVNLSPEDTVSSGAETVASTIGTTLGSSPALGIRLRDNWESDQGTCSLYVEQPKGYYFKDNGTLRSSAFGYISCGFQNGFRPTLYVTVQLQGYGPYNFTTSGSNNSCASPSNQFCGIQDVLWFNLDCGQRGNYDHHAWIYGRWNDPVGQWHSTKIEGPSNTGRYYRVC